MRRGGSLGMTAAEGVAMGGYELMVSKLGRGGELVEWYETVEGALRGARETWNEETGRDVSYVVVNCDSGAVEATLMRTTGDHELCLTMHADGKVECHRCHYVLDAEGEYERTEVPMWRLVRI